MQKTLDQTIDWQIVSEQPTRPSTGLVIPGQQELYRSDDGHSIGIRKDSYTVFNNDKLVDLTQRMASLTGGFLFGASVAIDNGIIVIGEAYVARVYEKVGSQWALTGSIRSPDPEFLSSFGQAVDLLDETIIVGDFSHNHGGSAQGAVYIFDRVAGSWQFTH